MREQISALVDNEIQDELFLDQLLEHSDTSERWQRYHMIGDIMRGEHKPGLDFDIASTVAQALTDEPVYNIQVETPENKTNDDSKVLRSNVVSLFSKGGYYAIAASVAVAVLLGASQLTGNPAASPDAAKVFETLPFSGMASPVSLSLSSSEQMLSQDATQLSEEELLAQKKRINAFLQDHQMQQRN